MGFSVTITSSIILIAVLAISTSFLAAFFQGLKDLSYLAKEYTRLEREKLDVAFELKVDSVNATTCNITVVNKGSRAIILKDQGDFKWNTIILSYGDGSVWRSYLIEHYEILEVKVSGTDYAFNLENHGFLNPGEEAKISFSIPYGAPEIPPQGLVSIVFVTHYGVAAKKEAVRG
ncbi:MAG: hypothetical protein RMJ15_05095 [Nitrososphaerota archaeon]|nr:hypothetical protein [Candidatus Bathyarchaeota archaeon]MDW8023096.1 hypothetical protein [Nitrososphaerota archaeon]